MSGDLVYILDDDADLADSVARLIRREGFRSEPFQTAGKLLEALAQDVPHCIVTDVMMPDADGFEFARCVRERESSVAIVFMTAWPTTRDAVDAVRRYGGIDYLDKPLDSERLIQAVVEGTAWSRAKRQALERVRRLSRREREVLDRLARGYSNKQIAAELSLSIRTVEDHRAAVMRKTGASSIAELVELASALG